MQVPQAIEKTKYENVFFFMTLVNVQVLLIRFLRDVKGK